MFTSTTPRKWVAALVLAVLAAASTARADDTERADLIAAIDAVNVKIDTAFKAYDEISARIPKIVEGIEYNKKMYDETQKDEYIVAYEALVHELGDLTLKQQRIEIRIGSLHKTLAYLEEKLDQLGD